MTIGGVSYDPAIEIVNKNTVSLSPINDYEPFFMNVPHPASFSP
jgi:hypothetical protein